MVFSQYTETCEVIIEYLKIGGYDIEDYANNSVTNILPANSDIHRRRLIYEFPMDGIKCIKKLASNDANMNFLTKVDMTGLFNRSHKKEENLQWITLKDSRMHMLCKFM